MLPVLIAIPLLLIWIVCVVDVVRRKDLTTGHKWLWALFVLLVPIIGVIAYLVTRPPQPGDWSQPGEQGDQTFEPIRRRHGPA